MDLESECTKHYSRRIGLLNVSCVIFRSGIVFSCIEIEFHLFSIFALFYEKSLTGSYEYNINLNGTGRMLITEREREEDAIVYCLLYYSVSLQISYSAVTGFIQPLLHCTCIHRLLGSPKNCPILNSTLMLHKYESHTPTGLRHEALDECEHDRSLFLLQPRHTQVY